MIPDSGLLFWATLYTRKLRLCRLLIPESPRWLAVHGRYEEVTKLLEKICKINGRNMPEDFNPKDLLEEVTSLARALLNYSGPNRITLRHTKRNAILSCFDAEYLQFSLPGVYNITKHIRLINMFSLFPSYGYSCALNGISPKIVVTKSELYRVNIVHVPVNAVYACYYQYSVYYNK